jgi:magnesium-transporting ATPase (P-type)
LTQLNKQERAAYCATYWEGQFKRIAALDFTRDRKLMSVLATRKGQSILFTKGAPEAGLSQRYFLQSKHFAHYFAVNTPIDDIQYNQSDTPRE